MHIWRFISWGLPVLATLISFEACKVELRVFRFGVWALGLDLNP